MAKDTLRTAIYTLHGRIVKAKVLVKKIVFFFFKQSKQIIVAAQRPLCVSLSLACTVACSLGESVPVRGGAVSQMLLECVPSTLKCGTSFPWQQVTLPQNEC